MNSTDRVGLSMYFEGSSRRCRLIRFIIKDSFIDSIILRLDVVSGLSIKSDKAHDHLEDERKIPPVGEYPALDLTE